MGRIIYALQFRGQAVPSAHDSHVVQIEAAASSCRITTRVDDQGVGGTLQTHESGAGSEAVIKAEARLTGEHAFHEKGAITFGSGGHILRFRSLGEGYIGPSAEPGLRHGGVVWRVEGGEGQFAGASGLITANFTVGEAGDLTVDQLGVLFV
jgi:hypothetical protein